MDVDIVNVQCSKPRSKSQVGVVKCELATIEQKVDVLRNKRKCDDIEGNPPIIKSCESPQERIARINSKFLLSQLDLMDSYTITGHGIIQAKKDKDDIVLNDMSGDDENPAPVDERSTAGKMSDNTPTREQSDKNKQQKPMETPEATQGS